MPKYTVQFEVKGTVSIEAGDRVKAIAKASDAVTPTAQGFWIKKYLSVTPERKRSKSRV